jgi:predicted Ser/Thr protein kinase
MNGWLIQGKFEVLDEIGHGGMGVVYRARQVSLDRIVALKMLSARLVDDEQFQERFRQEAKIIARLNHPNIIQVYDIFDIEDEGGFCIVMEYLDGDSLATELRRSKRLDVPRVLSIARQVAAGLAYAHGKGIIHRDIKPDNIMLLGGDQVKIMDFGIARLLDSSLQTRTGISMGTPQFMAPEQARSQTVDARTDLYSLAVVLYNMLAGEPPFTGDSPISIALKQVQESPRPPSELNPSIPPELESLVLRGMQKDPAKRFGSATELRDALGRIGSTAGAAAGPVPTGEETFIDAPTPAVPPPSVPPRPPDSAELEPAQPARADQTPASAAPWADSAGSTTTAALPRRFGWGWLVAAVPGVLALVIVLVYVFGPGNREPVNPYQLRRASFARLMSRIGEWQQAPPDRVRQLIQENEQALYDRVADATRNSTGPRPNPEARMARQFAHRVIWPHLPAERRARWAKLVGVPRNGGPGPPGPSPERRVPDEPGDHQRIESVLDQLDETPEIDPAWAQIAYEEAQSLFGRLEDENRPTTDPRHRSVIFEQGLAYAVDSVRYDPEAWHHAFDLAVSLTRYMNEFMDGIPRSRIYAEAQELLAQALKECPDPEERERIRRRDRGLEFAQRVNGWIERGMPEMRRGRTTDTGRRDSSRERPRVDRRAPPRDGGRGGPPAGRGGAGSGRDRRFGPDSR